MLQKVYKENRGFLSSQHGETHHGAKLTEVQVREARRLYWDRGLCVSCIYILMELPVKRNHLWAVIHFFYWKDVK